MCPKLHVAGSKELKICPAKVQSSRKKSFLDNASYI